MNITWSDIKTKALTVDRTTRFGGNGPIGDEVIWIDNGCTKIVKGADDMAYIINGSHALYNGRARWPLAAVYEWLDD